jgi:predicted naringenin-chalcone synthase
LHGALCARAGLEIVDHVALSAGVERTVIGFMGCYAAIKALKPARTLCAQMRMRVF